MTQSISLKDMLINPFLCEVLFSDFIIGQEYEIVLTDFTNAREHKDNRSTFNYMVVDGYSVNDYQFPPLLSNRKITFHFSIPTFMFAWQRASIGKLLSDKKYDIYLRFIRENQKKFMIKEARIHEIY